MAKKKKKKKEKAKKKPKPKKSKETPKPKRKEHRMKEIVRVAETDLDGTQPVNRAIRNVKGVSFMFSNIISKISGLGNKKLADLSESEQNKIEDIINNPQKYDIPVWMYNRRSDPTDGKNKHLSVSDLEFTTKMDINRLKKIRCYRGVRHAAGLPVRGQKTKSSFRKGKIVGVVKKKALKAIKPKEESGK